MSDVYIKINIQGDSEQHFQDRDNTTINNFYIGMYLFSQKYKMSPVRNWIFCL